MKRLHWTLTEYANGTRPASPVHGTDHVCEPCYSKPDVQADYQDAKVEQEKDIRRDGEWISCTLCGLETREIGS